MPKHLSAAVYDAVVEIQGGVPSCLGLVPGLAVRLHDRIAFCCGVLVNLEVVARKHENRYPDIASTGLDPRRELIARTGMVNCIVSLDSFWLQTCSRTVRLRE